MDATRSPVSSRRFGDRRAERFGRQAQITRHAWQAVAAQIEQAILDRAWDPELNSLTELLVFGDVAQQTPTFGTGDWAIAKLGAKFVVREAKQRDKCVCTHKARKKQRVERGHVLG
jgi:hypothetical protein